MDLKNEPPMEQTNDNNNHSPNKKNAATETFGFNKAYDEALAQWNREKNELLKENEAKDQMILSLKKTLEDCFKTINEKQLNEMNVAHLKELAQLKIDHGKLMERLQCAHSEDVKQLKKTYVEQMKGLVDAYNELINAINQLKIQKGV